MATINPAKHGENRETLGTQRKSQTYDTPTLPDMQQWRALQRIIDRWRMLDRELRAALLALVNNTTEKAQDCEGRDGPAEAT